MTITVRDGGLTSTPMFTVLEGADHVPGHVVLGGSMAITGGTVGLTRTTDPLGSVSVSGGSLALLRENLVLGSVNIGGGTVAVTGVVAGGSVNILGGTMNVTPPAVQGVQFGLSSAVMGQRTMSQSIPVTLASDQPSINVTTSGGGSVVVLGGSLQIAQGAAPLGSVMIAGQPIAVTGAAGAGSVNVLGGTIQLIGPALVTPVQFGLSSTVVGQQAMSLSVPVAVATNQTPVPVYGNMLDSGAGKTLRTAVVGLQNSGTIVPAVSGRRIKVYAAKIVASAALSFKFTNSGQSDLEGGQNFAANGGFVEDINPPAFLFATALGSSLDVALSGSGVAGRVSYWDNDDA